MFALTKLAMKSQRVLVPGGNVQMRLMCDFWPRGDVFFTEYNLGARVDTKHF